jgi:hypothetical protein
MRPELKIKIRSKFRFLLASLSRSLPLAVLYQALCSLKQQTQRVTFRAKPPPDQSGLCRLPGSGRYRGIFSNSGRRTKGLSRGMSRRHNEKCLLRRGIYPRSGFAVKSISNVFGWLSLASDSRAGPRATKRRAGIVVSIPGSSERCATCGVVDPELRVSGET